MDPHTPFTVPVVPGNPAPTPSQPTSPQARVNRISVVLFAAAAVVFLAGLSLFVAAGNVEPQVIASPSPVVVTSYITREIQVPAAPQTTQPPAAPTVPTVGDGTWTVGTDVPAGKYKTTAPVGSNCYWSLTKTGSNGEDIISNDIPGGGRPQVDLRAGQDFKTSRCGTWAKVG